MSNSGCRYPRPCANECCDDLYESGQRTVTLGRSISPDNVGRECFECFAIGYHESWCVKGE